MGLCALSSFDDATLDAREIINPGLGVDMATRHSESRETSRASMISH
jgi:hypothetical protein